ncbi:molybdenum ABC transporter ATP-binding protein [Massilibacteroides vaginae]|uniref:molybdenum ABC transporter ATP-binding protein n=1 Tax=Massilibacteroides vaginae TaxID=1673718 RepID=UPI000A1CBCF8|nr:molybdenum ABC transporter ATP-binding protein [Massilibacteroides vaginae]
MNTTVIASKFVKWEVPELNTLKNSKAYLLREKLNTGNKLTREEKNWITEKVNHNTYFKSAIPLQGYRFDFSDILKTYVVKQYGQYQEYKAIDRTSLRAMIYGRINKIIEEK